MWNLKNNINEKNRNKSIDTQGRRAGRLREKDEGIEKYRVVVTE